MPQEDSSSELTWAVRELTKVVRSLQYDSLSFEDRAALRCLLNQLNEITRTQRPTANPTGLAEPPNPGPAE